MGSMTINSQVSAGLIILVLLFFSLTTGCQTIRYESRFMKKKRAEGVQYKLSAAELRVQLDDLAGAFAGTIEQAADQVIAASADNDVIRHALLWKINAIPMAYRALFQPDPAVAYTDIWAFSLQMVYYFEYGPGQEDLGQWHHIALDASRKLEAKVMAHVANAQLEDKTQSFRVDLINWVRKHPIERDFFFRDTVVPVLESETGELKMGALQTVGSLAAGLDDIAQQFSAYMNLLTKQARWQAEWVMMDALKKLDIPSGLKSINELMTSVNRLTPMLEQAPDLVERERLALIKSLRQERIEVLANIESQRRDTLAFLKGERIAVLEDVTSERSIVMDILQSEREAIIQQIDLQRIATLVEIESAGSRIVENALNQSKLLIDHFFIRILQLLAVIFVCLATVAVIIFCINRRRKKAAPKL
jgi:hypothetical protein